MNSSAARATSRRSALPASVSVTRVNRLSAGSARRGKQPLGLQLLHLPRDGRTVDVKPPLELVLAHLAVPVEHAKRVQPGIRDAHAALKCRLRRSHQRALLEQKSVCRRANRRPKPLHPLVCLHRLPPFLTTLSNRAAIIAVTHEESIIERSSISGSNIGSARARPLWHGQDLPICDFTRIEESRRAEYNKRNLPHLPVRVVARPVLGVPLPFPTSSLWPWKVLRAAPRPRSCFRRATAGLPAPHRTDRRFQASTCRF